MPSGPVTHGKAWIEMTHRYLATGVGALITLLVVLSWIEARRGRAHVSPWWATATLAWVCLQGAFGALTVTMKLYPLVVTAHLLGGIGLLVLLAIQGQAYVREPLALPRRLRAGVIAVAVLALLQIALGGWVSTNYAVLACRDFPTCQGSWWPSMDFAHGFTLLRELGAGADGGFLPFAALTAIHYVHRLAAYVVLAALAGLAWRLHASGVPALRRWGLALGGVALWQFASGLGNVLFGWPLAAALAHTGGAAVLATLLAVLLTRASQARARVAFSALPPQPAGAAP
jgi:cytochrome c oxidase assembly protein subunit 15